MTITNGYITEIELRGHFKDAGDKLDTVLVERAISATSRAIDRHCGRHFWVDATVTTRTYRPDCDDIAWVHDISSTTGLVIKTDTGGDGSWSTTWAATDYELEPEDAAVDGWPWWRIRAVDRYEFLTTNRRRHLQVTALFGWPAVPEDVKEAAILRAAAIFKRKEAPFGVAGFGEFGVVRIGRADPDVVELLGPYRRNDLGVVG